MKTVTVVLKGGLGNQLFQYAFARHLSCKENARLFIDCSWYENQKDRVYSLHYFFLNDDSEVNLDSNSSIISARIFNAVKSLIFPRKKNSTAFIKETSFAYDENMLEMIADNVVCEGYFQSYKYFDNVADLILKDLSFKYQMPANMTAAASKVLNTEAVCVHVRRGDYVSNSTANKFHGLCSLEYYKNAMELIASRVLSPAFYVFTDDPEWVKNNFDCGFPFVLVENSFRSDLEDLRLMTMCKHYIIANSSFSWWAAWLSRAPKKIVIAPKKWFVDDSINTSSMHPPGWILV